jgi:radical SAM protein with 4Fe4S-binding SPASM domain
MKTTFKEISYVLPVVTPRRVWNYAKVVTSFYVSKILKRPVVWGLPIYLLYEPTNYCNLRCPQCPTGTRELARPEGMVHETDAYRKTVDELAKDSFLVQLYFQGESYLSPKFFEMVEYASSKNLFSEISTNAHFLTDDNCRRTIEAGLTKMIISIDGTTQEVFEKYRVRGRLSKVIEGTKRMIEWKKKLGERNPYIVFQFIVFSHNEHQIEDIKKLGKELGVDEVSIKTAQIYNPENGNELMPRNEQLSRYEKGADGQYHIKSDLANHCWFLWHTASVTWDNRVVPCCFDKHAKYQMGDTASQSFRDIWHSKQYTNFRQAILRGRKNIDMCTNCTEGLKVLEA